MTRIAVQIIVALLIYVPPFFAQTPQQPDTTVQSTSLTTVSDVQSFWAMTQLSGGIGYIILAVLIIGLFLLIVKFVELLFDWQQAKPLIKTDYFTMDSAGMLSLAQEKNKTILGSTLEHLLLFHRAGGTAISTQDELITIINERFEQFEGFKGRISFLSESAGALGLLGTVWGVFLTFFGGNLDSEKILNGMGVALITTLLGLVVSLILNFGLTEISNLFSRRLKQVKEIADQLRLRLLEVEPTAIDSKSSLQQKAPRRKSEESNPESPARLILVHSTPSIKAGEIKEKAFRCRVVSGTGQALSKEKMQVRVKGAITLKGGKENAEFLTDKHGDVSIAVQGKKEPGSGSIILSIAAYKEISTSASIEVVPAEPAKMKILSGNDQAARVETELPEPLKVQVVDRFDNPVPNVGLKFEIGTGNGRFAGGNHTFSTQTDSQGEASTQFKIGARAGFHSIHARITDAGKCAPVEFRILARE